MSDDALFPRTHLKYPLSSAVNSVDDIIYILVHISNNELDISHGKEFFIFYANPVSIIQLMTVFFLTTIWCQGQTIIAPCRPCLLMISVTIILVKIKFIRTFLHFINVFYMHRHKLEIIVNICDITNVNIQNKINITACILKVLQAVPMQAVHF